MHVRHDLRHELGIVASRAVELEKAFQALPDTDAAMDEALASMAGEERAQAAEYVRTLGQRCYAIRQECLWIVQRLQGGGSEG